MRTFLAMLLVLVVAATMASSKQFTHATLHHRIVGGSVALGVVLLIVIGFALVRRAAGPRPRPGGEDYYGPVPAGRGRGRRSGRR